MKIFYLLNLLLIFQASFFPKIFWWQVPVGLISFYLAFFLLIFSNRRYLYLINCLLWLTFNYCAQVKTENNYNQNILINYDQNTGQFVEFNQQTFQFVLDQSSDLQHKELINDLEQKTGRVTILKTSYKSDLTKTITFAAVEIESLFSFNAWEASKILLRRVSSLLRQENGQVIVYMKGQGPFFLAVARTFAFQARLSRIKTTNFLFHISGLGSELIFIR